MNSIGRRAAAGTAVSIVIFVVSALITGAFRNSNPAADAAHPWISQFVLKSLLAGLSLAAIAVFGGRRWADYGFQRAKNVRWTSVLGPALAMGAAGSIVILLGGGEGLTKVVEGYGFPAIVFWIWFYSSVTEEIFTRAWYQSYLRDGLGARGATVAMTASAALFAAMHLSLLLRGIDRWTVAVIVVFAALLGRFAAGLRQRYESLAPAIGAHIGFNVGGLLGGVVYTIGYRITTGHLPVR
jgi:membrane protease YdiL (CAAX protease family)